MTAHCERQLLEKAARAIGFAYLMYVPATHPHASGLLYRNAAGRLKVWNPRINDADLLQLAVAVPSVNLHTLIIQARDASTDDTLRRKHVRESFLSAISQHTSVTLVLDADSETLVP
ncbi:hypothetical protein GPY61_30215 [Massilia sp. NEAU-DD11]|uniref:Uncharacterized protein n=1 Tax=Massilia cellulosiltytica TaxID=2683234 RepID=A0A7X3G7P8_9BURK|nr:hypothetical protein [Telluria cellulosilytica]MVW64212.1 hypothetical protein [Telluria cellulosilytica]